MIKLLIGGSPCAHWSIAQTKNRETEASGIGWELFLNYCIAKEKFKPDYFLYENNKSAAKAIKDEIKKRLGVWDETLLMEDSGSRYIEINSALVSAQNRQRFYVHNCGEVFQPKDRGILLRDVLESGVVEKDKGYCLKHQAGNARDYFKKHHTNIAFEPLNITSNGKSQTIKAQYGNTSLVNICCYKSTYGASGVAVPVRIPKYSTQKSRPLTASYKNKGCGEGSLASECFPDNPNKQVFDFVAEPVRVGTYPSEAKNKESKQYRIYDIDGKSTTLCGMGGGMGAKTGLYAVPCFELSDEYFKGKERIVGMTTQEEGKYRNGNQPSQQYRVYNSEHKSQAVSTVANEKYIVPVYEVKDGKITIKDKQYPIKLKDGFYIIRKLTVTECCRLQTLPDDYCRAVSDTQAYKCLGNGWTAEVIIHILSHALKNVPKDEKIVVLSMYDGIATGRYCLDKMGFTNIEYHTYEIDKYAIKVAMSNYPDIIQHGDAFQVRQDWKII